jgi:hypothetical protein
MSDEPEVSESGAPIYRHQQSRHDYEGVNSNDSRGEEIAAHVEQHIGKPASVFHEIISDLVHVDVHIVEPTRERNFFTLFTTGMSDRPMAAPPDLDDCRFAELLICLPADWKLGPRDFDDEGNYWPVRWLKVLARLPHQYETWLFTGHTVPNGDPAWPFADNTALCCALLRRPRLFGEQFPLLELDDRMIHFLALTPLYAEEMAYKLCSGFQKLEDRLDDAGVTELLNPKRFNTCL